MNGPIPVAQQRQFVEQLPDKPGDDALLALAHRAVKLGAEERVRLASAALTDRDDRHVAAFDPVVEQGEYRGGEDGVLGAVWRQGVVHWVDLGRAELHRVVVRVRVHTDHIAAQARQRAHSHGGLHVDFHRSAAHSTGCTKTKRA